jgi:hypothetical protein
MNAIAPNVNESYNRYVGLLLQHHRHLSHGTDESDAAMVVEDAMTELWECLDPAQRESLAGLSSDLNWVRWRGMLAPSGRRPEEIAPAVFRALHDAQTGAHWHQMLHLLRLCAPAAASDQLACLRALAWFELGQPLVAGIFKDFATALESRHGEIE